jgi:uncharacterized protein (DUF2147 family)
MKTLSKNVCLAGTMVLATLSFAQASTPAALPTPTGYWKVVDDNVVIEFVACTSDKDAMCAVVRGAPPPNPKEEPPPKCGEVLGQDFKPEKDKQRWAGKFVDNVEGKSYKARLQAGKNGGLDLTIILMGGLYSETIALVPVKDHTPCKAAQ